MLFHFGSWENFCHIFFVSDSQYQDRAYSNQVDEQLSITTQLGKPACHFLQLTITFVYVMDILLLFY